MFQKFNGKNKHTPQAHPPFTVPPAILARCLRDAPSTADDTKLTNIKPYQQDIDLNQQLTILQNCLIKYPAIRDKTSALR